MDDGRLPRIEIHRHEAEDATWEAVLGTPDPRLRRCVAGAYHGWTERTSAIMRRREVAKIIVPVIINFGPRFGVLSLGNPTRTMERFDTFVAGLHDCAAITEADLTSHCVQVNFTPLGAYRLLGIPMAAIANRVVEIEDILGTEIRRLRDRLYDARSWDRRFALLDAFLVDRLAASPAADPRVLVAMRRLDRSGGSASIGSVAGEVDLSRARLIGLFNEQIGLGPKTVARLIRFDRVIQRLETGAGTALAELALDAGYYDQPHFNREFRQFAGVAPTDFVDARLPDGGGIHEA